MHKERQMSIASLPFATFLLFLEFAVGTHVMLLLPQYRGRDDVSPGFIKMGAIMGFSVALLALWAASALPGGDVISGYRLDQTFSAPARMATLIFTVLSGIVLAMVWRNDVQARAKPVNAVTSVFGLAAIALTAAMIRLPTWGYAGTLLALLAGALSLGAVSLGMTLGHWYLVTPRLPARPLNELTMAALVIIGVQCALVALNVFLPVRETPLTGQTALSANLWFWLRIGVGLVFPLALAFMAWQSSVVKAMMSATGLLYIAMGSVLAGEILARALMFATAKPL